MNESEVVGSEMRSAKHALSLPHAAGIGRSTRGSERFIIALSAACFGGAAWAFSSVAPEPYMVREATAHAAVWWKVLLFVAKGWRCNSSRNPGVVDRTSWSWIAVIGIVLRSNCKFDSPGQSSDSVA